MRDEKHVSTEIAGDSAALLNSMERRDLFIKPFGIASIAPPLSPRPPPPHHPPGVGHHLRELVLGIRERGSGVDPGKHREFQRL